ncbi:MAG TPA: SURF1 family protein [Longimicrobiales bacterium]
MARTPLRITPGGVAATIGVMIVAAVCVRLGFWQLDRLEWRLERNRLIAERLALPAVPVASAELDTAGLAYRRVELRGEYDNARSFVLAGRAHGGAPGVHVITPLRLEGGGVVLVNRGWLPAPDAATVELAPYDVVGPVRLIGMAVPFFAPAAPREADARARTSTPVRVSDPDDEDAAAPVWFRPDAAAVRASLPYPVADFIVQALPEAATADDVASDGGAAGARAAAHPPGGPTRIGPPELDRGPHLSYAVQWFCFAAIAVIGWGVMVGKARRTAGRPPAAQAASRGSSPSGPASRP